MKQIKPSLLKVLYSLARVYWFIRRPQTKGVKVVITDGERILLVKHTYIPHDNWTFPGGRIEPGESPSQTARREIREELGLELEDLEELNRFTSTAEFKRDTVFVFTARPSDLPDRPASWEIAEVRWFEQDDLPLLPPIARSVWSVYNQRVRK